MKRKFKKIPENLKSQVIAITGSLPGVGKSYSKEKIAENLKSQGWQVILTGSTNKACMLKDGSKVNTVYSSHVAGWAESKKVMAQAKGFVRRKEEDCKIFRTTNAFLFVDEAFMLSQTDLDLLQKQYPQCCIVLFGDPNQFPPIEDLKTLQNFEEMGKDQYSPYIAKIKEAIKKGIAKDKIFNVDYVFNLNKQYRVKTPELEKFLKNVKAGFPSELQLLQFLQKHQYNPEKKYDFAICRTWENGVYKWQDSDYRENKRIFRNLVNQVNGVYVGQNNIGAIKNSLYDVKGHSFENDLSITDTSDFQNYKLQGGVTCHSIQGTTLNKGTKVIVDVDDALTIVDENFQDVVEDFQRFLYISASRVQDDEDIVFKLSESNVDKLSKVMSKAVEMESLKSNIELSSEELINLDFVEYLNGKLECKVKKETRRVSHLKDSNTIELLKKLWNDEKGISFVNYSLLTNIIIANNLIPPTRSDSHFIANNLAQLSINDLRYITGKSFGVVRKHKEEILGKLQEMIESVIGKEKEMKKEVATIGKTIGEIEQEEKKDTRKDVSEMSDLEVAKEIELYGTLLGREKVFEVYDSIADDYKPENYENEDDYYFAVYKRVLNILRATN